MAGRGGGRKDLLEKRKFNLPTSQCTKETNQFFLTVPDPPNCVLASVVGLVFPFATGKGNICGKKKEREED